jgi:photosystem II stability/assembly factor-like uncharacterized protein
MQDKFGNRIDTIKAGVIMRKILTLIVLLLLNLELLGNPKQTIYVAVLQTQSYTVGAANPPTGLYRYESDTTWTHLGWKNARNFGIAVDPSNPNYLFLASGNGALRSLDGGQNWKITTDWRMTEILDIVMAPQQPDHVYLASAYGIWRTTDRGETWIAANQGLKPTFVQTIAADRSSPDRLFAGGEGGLFETIDGAKSWKKLEIENTLILDLTQSSSAPENWIVGTEDKGVLLSKDNGKSWRFATGKISNKTIYAVAVDPADTKRMAAGGFKTGVFISADGGNTWSQNDNGLASSDIHALVFDLEKPVRIWTGTLGAGVFYSDDLGKTWNFAGLRGADVWDMVIVPYVQ